MLPHAAACTAMSPFGRLLPLHDEGARSTLLRCLVPGVSGACVFLAEEHSLSTAVGREHERVARVAGLVMGERRYVWHSTQPVVEMLGGFADTEAIGAQLRASFRDWARRSQHVTCAVIDGVAEKL